VRPLGPLIHFGQLFRLALSREQGATVREKHTLTPSGDLKETVEWLEWRGYRCAVSEPYKTPLNSVPAIHAPGNYVLGYTQVGKMGVLFGRKNEPLFLAQVGDVLVWDGQNVTIQE
jgi:hypothetical protein